MELRFIFMDIVNVVIVVLYHVIVIFIVFV